MGRAVVSHVARDMKPLESEELAVLLVATDGVREAKLYRDLDVVREDFPDVSGSPSKIYRKVSQLFNQGKTTMARSLYRKVKIVGFAAPESPADLVDAIESYRENDDEWEVLLTDRDDVPYIQALIAYAESTEPTLAELLTGIEDHRKFYFAQTVDKTFEFNHTRGAVIYVNDLSEEGDAACIGNVATFYPERVTWQFKTPDGVTVANLTEGEKDALDDQHVNYLTREYRKYTFLKRGICTDGEFIDALLGSDYIAKRIRDRIYTLLTTTKDVPYSDDGFTLVGSEVITALNEAVDYNIIAVDPESGLGMFVVNIPTRADATEEQARNRVMPDITWEATVEGAVHEAVSTGVMTVSLVRPET